MRKAIQILVAFEATDAPTLYALCDDGTVYGIAMTKTLDDPDPVWHPLPKIGYSAPSEDDA